MFMLRLVLVGVYGCSRVECKPNRVLMRSRRPPAPPHLAATALGNIVKKAELCILQDGPEGMSRSGWGNSVRLEQLM